MCFYGLLDKVVVGHRHIKLLSFKCQRRRNKHEIVKYV